MGDRSKMKSKQKTHFGALKLRKKYAFNENQNRLLPKLKLGSLPLFLAYTYQ